MKGVHHAVHLGQRAAQQGRSLQSNPYRHSGKQWSNAWLRGYRSEKSRIRRNEA